MISEAQRLAWNAVLVSGDAEAIEAMQDDLLIQIHTGIMNDDPRYHLAGWTGDTTSKETCP